MSIGEVRKVEDLKRPQHNKVKQLNEEYNKVRVRRTQSVTKAEKIVDVERKTRKLQSDKPCHKTRDSLFSWSSGFDKYEGFVNWGAFILILGGLRLFLENMNKYGLQISFYNVFNWLVKENQNDYYFHTPLLLLFSNVHYLYSFALEHLMLKRTISTTTGTILQVIHLITVICTPIVLFKFYADAFSLLGRTIISSVYVVSLLKLWSYAQVNHWCRVESERNKKYHRRRSYSFKKLVEAESSDDNQTIGSQKSMERMESYCPVEYPDNLKLSDLYYFLAAPTLCYELNFPRSHSIRYRFLLRRMLEGFILSNVLVGLFQQWIIPSVKNSLKPISEMDYMRSTERVLKLAIPNHLLWLIWFYLFFHSFLNTVGELLRFGDRNFYQDWWNAKDVGTFWRDWNLPVHKWAVRHFFVPVLSMKYSKLTASIGVFFLSAFLHEYSVSVPLGMYKIGVFLGMCMQVPLVYLSQDFSSRFGYRVGNGMVWASLIVGQPIGIMVYCHDYIIQNYGSVLFGE